MNPNQRFLQFIAAENARRAEALAAAKLAAQASGKEPFDLDQFYALWRDNPDARHAASGLDVPVEERRREWEEHYYVTHLQVRTIQEFVTRLQESQAHGFFE